MLQEHRSPPPKAKTTNYDRTAETYYQEVGKFPVLNPQQELELFWKYKNQGDMRARDSIIGNCLRYVVKLARRYSQEPDVVQDLIAAGNIGILQALERYDPDRKTRFISYATFWILLRIREELRGVQLVATPVWKQKALRKVRQMRASQARHAAPDVLAPPTAASAEIAAAADRNICEQLKISPKQLNQLESLEAFQYVDTPDAVADKRNRNEDTYDTETARKCVQEALMCLPSKEQFVMKAYFGMSYDVKTSRSIASILDVTSERVRQIREVALHYIERHHGKMFKVLLVTVGQH